ncbi:response regulator transcription factor [Pedobacter punctiformis]|uniref:Response regulator transcription factor n=1 Tax=Pedobacter punctiformis TaxID=3004097 RepID=A0ABT4L8W4_9SPHI|nr:response regulator transcription factor [Pedobacter sp. HCMS5-2]MCZ4244343.1 response regulator transcription factor [Pedobacter sp. HCMS5-2]
MIQEQKIRIIIADDHVVFREGLAMVLSSKSNIDLVGAAGNGEQLVKLANNLKPDVVITDIKMPVMDGIEAVKRMVKNQSDLGIIALSMFDEEDLIVEMLEAGAKGYLLKNADKNDIYDAITAVSLGNNFYCKTTSAKLAMVIARSRIKKENKPVDSNFSEREIEIIKLICQEFTNKKIADQLYLSVRTVEGYRAKLLEKMHVKNSIGLAIHAFQLGIISGIDENG